MSSSPTPTYPQTEGSQIGDHGLNVGSSSDLTTIYDLVPLNEANPITSANKKATNWWDRKNFAPLKLYTKPSEAVFSAAFSNFSKCQLEVADDIISGVGVD